MILPMQWNCLYVGVYIDMRCVRMQMVNGCSKTRKILNTLARTFILMCWTS